MTANAIIKEISKLTITEKLLLVEKTLRSIRQEKEHSLHSAADTLYNDYRTDKDLTAFSVLDAQSFYEAR